MIKGIYFMLIRETLNIFPLCLGTLKIIKYCLDKLKFSVSGIYTMFMSG